MSVIITDYEQLNDLVGFKKSIPYIQYFFLLGLDDDTTKALIDASEEVEDALEEFFQNVLVAEEYDLSPDWIYLERNLYDSIEQILEKKDFTSGSISSRKAGRNKRSDISLVPESGNLDTEYKYTLEKSVKEIVDTTKKNLKKGKEYYFSKDRAMLIAENEVNAYYNHQTFVDARNNGYSKKKWVAVMDRATRDSHKNMNGTVIPIDELFDVNGSLMRYPKDRLYNADAGEIVNCRCILTYIK